MNARPCARRTSGLVLGAVMALGSSAWLALPEAADAQVVSEGRVGTITATVDERSMTFPVIGRVSGENTEWGSTWGQNGPRVEMMIWGVSGSVEGADNQSDRMIVRLSFRMPESGPDLADISRECDPFGDRVSYTVDGDTYDLVADECGGIDLETLSYDEGAEQFTVRGVFSGELDDVGWSVTDGRFEAVLSRR